MSSSITTQFCRFLAVGMALAAFVSMPSTTAFTIPSLATKSSYKRTSCLRPLAPAGTKYQVTPRESTFSLSMYNLPPSGGGGGKNEIAEIAKGALSLLLVVGFFVSPLGGLVLGIFNSFLVLLFVLPLLATVGFQVWSSLNTVKGTCPNCGAPATVMKNKSNGIVMDDALPAQSLCFNCGAVLQANEDNTAINNVTGRRSIDDLSSSTGSGASIFDMFSGGFGEPTTWVEETITTTTTTTTSDRETGKGGVDKSSVIDVDVLDEDKPFQ